MRPYLSKKDEKILYWILVGILFASIAVYLVFQYFDWSIRLPMCMMLRFTGLYCPGCGGTRAFISLLHGRFLDSLYYHPIVLYGAAVGLWYLISHTIEYASRDKYRIGMRYRDIYLYIAVSLILLNWIIKNICWLVLGIRLI